MSNPKVLAPAEHLTLAAILLLSICSLISPSYSSLAFIAIIILLLNIGLVYSALKQTKRGGSPGKVLLPAAMVYFFWREAVSTALAPIPFAIASHLPLGAGQYSEVLVSRSYLYLAVFEVALFLGYSFRPRLPSVIVQLSTRVDLTSPLARAIPYVLALGGLLLAFSQGNYSLDVLFQGRNSGASPIGLQRGAFFSNLLSFLGVFGVAMLLVRATVVRRRRVPTVIYALSCSVPIVLSGTRHLLLFIALPALFAAAAKRHPRRNFRRSARLVGGGLLIVFIAQFMFLVRGEGVRALSSLDPRRLTEANVTEQFDSLLLALELVPSYHDYFYEVVEPHFLLQAIPRVVWSGRPEIASYRFYDDFATQRVRGSNSTPSVVGQYHMSWGWLGVIAIGLWLGFMTSVADRILSTLNVTRQWAMVTALGLFYAFLISSFRIYAPYYFSFFAVGTFTALALSRTAGRRRQPVLGPVGPARSEPVEGVGGRV